MQTRLLLTAVAVAIAGCGGNDTGEADVLNDTTDMSGAETTAMTADSTQAIATMRDSAGNELGTLRLVDDSGMIRIQGALSGLSAGIHAIHVHTIGACTPTFDAAGGHWNPTNAQHGRDNPAGPHMGDMANFAVSTAGTVQIDVVSSGGSLHGDPMALDADGASIVIHADADDYATDPSGASGARIGCGVITAP